MNIKEYCHKMTTELTGWEVKLSEELSKIEALPLIDKFKMLSIIEDLNIMVTEMNDRIDHLENECLYERFSFDDIEEDAFYHAGYPEEEAEDIVGSGNLGV